MTTPAEPATGAGEPGTGGTSDPAASGQQPATGGQNGANPWESLFEGLTPEQVKEKLDHARTWEKRSKENAKALEAAKKATQPKDGEPTLETLQQQLKEEAEAREAAEARAVEAAYTSTVTRVAATVGADGDALLDSAAFLKAVEEELGDDFDDDELRTAVTKVATEFAKKPRFAAGGPQTAVRAGSNMTGGAPAPPRQRPSSLHGAIKGTYGS